DQRTAYCGRKSQLSQPVSHIRLSSTRHPCSRDSNPVIRGDKRDHTISHVDRNTVRGCRAARALEHEPEALAICLPARLLRCGFDHLLPRPLRETRRNPHPTPPRVRGTSRLMTCPAGGAAASVQDFVSRLDQDQIRSFPASLVSPERGQSGAPEEQATRCR